MALTTSRTGLLLALAITVAMLAVGLWPDAQPVDTGLVRREPLVVTINEEGRTRLRRSYSITAPVAGHLLRVTLEPGDKVRQGQPVARLIPLIPSLLDSRSRARAEAELQGAEAAVAADLAGLEQARAGLRLATDRLERNRPLHKRGDISPAQWQSLQQAHDAAQARLQLAEAELARSRAGLRAAEAELRPVEVAPAGDAIALPSPVDGQVLLRQLQGEGVVSAGSLIMEIGDLVRDLEVLVELPSAEAVRVSPGDVVEIDDWGGAGMLAGVVERVEPSGFTKFSALGVEEQRVNVLIRFHGRAEARAGLGHGYRVEARIVVWRGEEVLTAPSGALFRQGEQWAVMVAEAGRARLTPVMVGQDNGRRAEILGGLQEGQRLVLYPDAALKDGARIIAGPAD